MLSEKMVEALQKAKEQDGYINRYQLHPSTRAALSNRGLLRVASGYEHGQLYELTEKGKQALNEI